MSIKPLIFLFFAWLLWGGIVTQNVLSQNGRNQQELVESKMQSQGQMLEWFFQERTLQLKGFHDEEPIVSRYSQDQWKKMDPWKGIVFLKGSQAYLYGAFDKMMPQAHRKQLTDSVKRLRPAGRIEGVHWEAFQWNGSAFIVAFVSRGQEAQAFIAMADDWGRSLSLISNDSGWYLTNQAGRIIFHSDVRYVGEKRPQQFQAELSRPLSTTNLIGRLQVPAAKSTVPLISQLVLITLGMALISSVLLSQLLKKERRQSEKQMEVMKKRLLDEHQENLAKKEAAPAPPPPVSNELLFKDLSHRVASSLGRQLQPSLINILGQGQWLISVSEGRNNEEKSSIETIIREARQSKNTLDKLLAVAGEKELHKFPMKLETPVLRALKRWEPEFLHENIILEKEIEDTSFFPLNSEALEKALSHLLQNSVEALTRRLDKKIKIEVRDEGPTLLLAVEDNGGGMESHHLTLISDPFFTTKNHQNRLGLGLTEAFGIFKQHHAIVTLTSEIGKGARFEIRFDKNAAQTLIEKSAEKAQSEPMLPEGYIVIPQNLPRPLEAESQKEEPLVAVSTAVDDEIEKLLELTDLDFIESPDKEILGSSFSATHEAETEADDEADFLDANPLSADRHETGVETETALQESLSPTASEIRPEVVETSAGDEEEDEFKMTGIPSRGLNA